MTQEHPRRSPSVSAVVVTYRNAGDVVACLARLTAALQGLPAEIIVVDNGSDDDTADLVRAARPDVTLVDRGVNDGFARGCHIGVEASSGDLLLFVNPDALVDADAVRSLVSASRQHPESGVLGGRAVREDGTTDPRSWWGRPTLWSTFCFAAGLSAAFPGHRLLDRESADGWDGRDREVDVVSGALMLVQRRLWDQLGGFDRQFLLYGEDVDLCLRARSAGWRPRVVAAATFQHSVGGSTAGGGRTALVMRGRASVLRRHLPPGTRALGVWLLVVGTGLRAALARWRPAGRGRRGGVTPPSSWQIAWRERNRWAEGWQVGDRLPGVIDTSGVRS